MADRGQLAIILLAIAGLAYITTDGFTKSPFSKDPKKKTYPPAVPHAEDYAVAANGVWSADSRGDIHCPGTLSKYDYCVYANDSIARAKCTADPKCIGYVKTNDPTNPKFSVNALNPGAAQLVYKTPVKNSAYDGNFFKK